MSADLIEELRAAAAVTVDKLIGNGWRGPVYAKRPNANAGLLTRAADALAAKDTALSEMRAELAEQKRLYDVQIAGHRLSAKDATTNLIRATKAEAELEMWRKVKHSSHWQERATAAEAELERARKALATADEAISEYTRYLDGGEMRGSYDGKPERDQLRKAGYAVRAASQDEVEGR